MKQRVISLLLTAAMALALLPMTALAAETVELDMTVRDFHEDGVLFEGDIASGEGLVQKTLGADKKPVYNLTAWQELFGAGVTQSRLNAFFTDTPGINKTVQRKLTMLPDGNGYWKIDSSQDAQGNYLDGFFPIDNELFGNEGNAHNYHFSVEIHTQFKYVQGGEFEFDGDDDVWVFFNNQLVIDLGGVHSSSYASVALDEIAPELGIRVGDTVSFDMFYMERHLSGSNLYMRTNFEFFNLNASAWAMPELERADTLGLIPDCLQGQDLTKAVTRGEFAAICVKLYENLAGTAALPAVTNPFTDTRDREILKAYNLGVTNGKYDSGTRFAPDEGLNRQEAATMLTRVFKRATMPGWTLAEDASFPLAYIKPAAFKDDAQIGTFARDSVYFMAANGIVGGFADGTFRPKNTTSAQEASGYASATRQQALVIAVRMAEKLG